ncbi:MAG: hypothetical protein WDO16_13180 [Bacteroidota bacterium]
MEVSVDGGTTWKLASGAYNWSYTWTPVTTGAITIKVRGYDDSGNMSVPGTAPSPSAITINSTDPQCPCTLYQPTDSADLTNAYNYVAGIELGVKFRAGINGYIKGLRFL